MKQLDQASYWAGVLSCEVYKWLGKNKNPYTWEAIMILKIDDDVPQEEIDLISYHGALFLNKNLEDSAQKIEIKAEKNKQRVTFYIRLNTKN